MPKNIRVSIVCIRWPHDESLAWQQALPTLSSRGGSGVKSKVFSPPDGPSYGNVVHPPSTPRALSRCVEGLVLCVVTVVVAVGVAGVFFFVMLSLLLLRLLLLCVRGKSRSLFSFMHGESDEFRVSVSVSCVCFDLT